RLRALTTCPIIKAVRVQTAADILAAQILPCDYLLLDTYTKDAYGGSGEAFDHTLIPPLRQPFFLAGGLNVHNIADAMSANPYAVDLSSGVETNGAKDAHKIKEIIHLIRQA
ncbi:MAG: phosphoribosylanthranilate isomerase, partial [Acetanaerobacterium sp.]